MGDIKEILTLILTALNSLKVVLELGKMLKEKKSKDDNQE